MRAHILVVEDERHLGVGIKYNLEAEGHRVSLVEDGPSALRLLEHSTQTIDLMILDLMLPGMSGYTVCEKIREMGSALPVLMLSARTLSEDRTRGFDVGANQYMSKPFDLDELISRVKNLLQTCTAISPSRVPSPPKTVESITFGRVEADFRTHQVSVDGEPIKMTPKELRLLRYFVENPERVINRSELLTQVWETSGNLQTRAVDQFIARLRKTIEPAPAEPIHLLTVRDAGYRFVLHPDEPSAKPDDMPDDMSDEEPDEETTEEASE